MVARFSFLHDGNHKAELCICGRPMVARFSFLPGRRPRDGAVFAGDQWSPLQVEVFGVQRCIGDDPGMEGQGFARRYQNNTVPRGGIVTPWSGSMRRG